MSFVHQDSDFGHLLDIVAREAGVAAALVEKDYWVTHTLWALHQTGLEIWFKGGTSLSKGFALIRRFSEDLDLMIRHGSAASLPTVSNWRSANKGQVAERRAFYNALGSALMVPGVRVEPDQSRVDKQARSADYLMYYPGAMLDQLAAPISPFVRVEVGSARVVPHVTRPISSFVHDYLADRGMLGDFDGNRPGAVRCVHPLVTLLEKIDAISRRYSRADMEPDSFVRHLEDAAQIIRATDRLPEAGQTAKELAKVMFDERGIAALPSSNEPALALADRDRRAAVERAYMKITPMFWGPRIPLDEACAIIRAWLDGLSAAP